MDNNETSWLPLHVKGNGSSHLNNHTEDLIYVFTPAGVFAKRALCLMMSAIGVMGFLGNCFLQYFLCQKPTKTLVQSNHFIRNLKMYGQSRSLADTISCVVSLPLFCIQMSFDVFQSGWPCKIVRYCNIAFPTIALNHLIAISFEKYLSTRSVPRTLYVSTVRKIIICAWIFGFVSPLFPMVTFEGFRVELNNTHYTVVCKYYQDYYPCNLCKHLFDKNYLDETKKAICEWCYRCIQDPTKSQKYQRNYTSARSYVRVLHPSLVLFS